MKNIISIKNKTENSNLFEIDMSFYFNSDENTPNDFYSDFWKKHLPLFLVINASESKCLYMNIIFTEEEENLTIKKSFHLEIYSLNESDNEPNEPYIWFNGGIAKSPNGIVEIDKLHLKTAWCLKHLNLQFIRESLEALILDLDKEICGS